MRGMTLTTAFVMAVRSAQIPAPYDAFSTLQPVMNPPSSFRNDAPTLYSQHLTLRPA
jgi:hypothetical protein